MIGDSVPLCILDNVTLVLNLVLSDYRDDMCVLCPQYRDQTEADQRHSGGLSGAGDQQS